MKLKTLMKTIGTFVNKSKTEIVKHGPQIMAVAGVGCFIAGTYCAIKETPKAMAKLEEKRALDPDMGKLQTMAVVGPEYKKTLACTAAGIAFTGLAWHLEAKYVATLLAGLSKLDLENKNLIEASKQVVGEEKTGEILAKKEEIAAEDSYETGSGKVIPSDQVPYLFKFPGGVKFWSTWAKFKAGMEYNRRCLMTNKNISLYEVLKELGADDNDLTQDMYNLTWNMDDDADCPWATDELMDGAYELLDYEAKPYNHGHGENYVAAWEIKWVKEPKKAS